MVKKIIITGATGLIGVELSNALVKRGDEVTIFKRNILKGKRKLPEVKRFIEWDYRTPGQWKSELSPNHAAEMLTQEGADERVLPAPGNDCSERFLNPRHSGPLTISLPVSRLDQRGGDDRVRAMLGGDRREWRANTLHSAVRPRSISVVYLHDERLG